MLSWAKEGRTQQAITMQATTSLFADAPNAGKNPKLGLLLGFKSLALNDFWIIAESTQRICDHPAARLAAGPDPFKTALL